MKQLKKKSQNLHSTNYQRQIAIFTSRMIKIAGFVTRIIPNADNTLFGKHNGKGTI